MKPGLLLTRYTLRLFGWCLLSFSSAALLLIGLFDFSELQRRSLAKGSLSFAKKVEMVLLKTPFLLEQLLPFILFGSALTLFWRLNRNHEWSVIRSTGLSVWQFSWPLLLLAFAIGAWDLALNQPVTAHLFKRYQHHNEVYFDQEQDTSVKISREGLWIQKRDPQHHIIYQIGKYIAPEAKVEGVSVYVFSNHHQFQVHYQAATGHLTDKGLVLHRGWVLTPTTPSQAFEALTLPYQLTLSDMHRTNQNLHTLSFWELPGIITLLDQAGLSSHKYRMQQASLIGRVLWLGAMVLLAAAFSLQPLRQGRSFLLLLIGGGTCFALYVIRDFSHALGMAGSLPIFLASQAPAILTFLLAVILLIHFEEGKV
jgi:lipopolysaccharide export system permease protein